MTKQYKIIYFGFTHITEILAFDIADKSPNQLSLTSVFPVHVLDVGMGVAFLS